MSYNYLNCQKALREDSKDEWYLKYNYDDVNEENATMIEYFINIWKDPYSIFQIILFKDKSLFDTYYEEHKDYADIIVIDENDEYKLAVKIEIETLDIEDIKYITDTIKLKVEEPITQQAAREIIEMKK